MIAPQELRLGNLVTINNQRAWPELKGIPLSVMELSTEMDEYEKELFPKSEGSITLKGDKETYNQFSQFIEPIELTEEWLEKFGFSNDGTMTYVNATEFSIYKKIDYKYYLSEWAGSTVGELKYVNQLQNLFHSLTGEELKIKES